MSSRGAWFIHAEATVLQASLFMHSKTTFTSQVKTFPSIRSASRAIKCFATSCTATLNTLTSSVSLKAVRRCRHDLSGKSSQKL